ncbi:Rne/Rng family ribonuclease [Neisseria leonii]|uniref:Rne/Rng family ribonuclease n=1 Tax=Neisseria leonii TaxID=2995413 RepID=UPI00237B528F|nr:Rne/Rng family ribonuclease [Neisseria sp. 3986]MDD9326647.1 Rne/Rng family ribonuclease [Neisseria sp. 3986]
MKRMLFNATQAEELRVAIVDGQTLLDLDIETLGKEQRKGNIYKGVITRIEPSLEACFVDYGTDRHGFLPFKEVSRSYFQDYDGGRARIQDVLKEGMQVIVQVEKDERGNKGAALTTFISLAGRYLVLMPNNPRGGGVSRRIEGEERQELKEAMAQLDVPRGMSLIARTAGIGRSVEELQWDFNYLLQLWQAIEAAGQAHSEPYLLFMESSLLIRAIRDYYRPDIGEILVDNPEVHQEVAEFMSYVMPGNVGRLKLYQDHTPLFSRFQIEHQIESAFARSVSLPSGGAIVIDHTEALVSIDVNSARATRGADIEDTAFKTNMEAAEEVARQMRLRDLGGLVVIDFIDMENPKHQRDVENVLRDALKKDRARVQMGKLSRFGLLELSRQRLKPALGESSHIACPRCAGTGVIRSIESTALHVLRIIQEEAMKDNTGEVHAQVPVDVATFLLNEKRAELFGLEERLDVSVFLIPNIHLENPHYEITRVRTDDIEENGEPSYKRVEVPPADENDKPFGGEKAKAARPEPAVKGLRHSQPAPVSETPAAPGWWQNLKNWFKGLFAAPEAAPAKPERKADGKPRQNGGRRNPQNRRRNSRHSKAQEADATAETPTGAAGDENRNGNRRKRHDASEQRNGSERHNERRSRNSETAAEDETLNNTPLTAVQNGQDDTAAATQPRRRPSRRQENRTPQETALPLAAETETVSDDAAPEAEQPQSDTANAETKPKRERSRSGSQRERNRRNDKKRHIPSAEKIEQYLMIDEAGDKVRAAVAHVYGETVAENRPAADDMPSDGPLIITLPAAEEAAQTPGTADSSEPLVVTLSPIENEADDAVQPEAEAHPAPEPADEDEPQPAKRKRAPKAKPKKAETVLPEGMVMVQTRTDAVAAADVPQPSQAKGLRRSDVPRRETAAAEPAEMVQVETHNG